MGKYIIWRVTGLMNFQGVIACCYDFTLEKVIWLSLLNTVHDVITQTVLAANHMILDTLYVTNVDTVEYNGIARKRLFLDGGQQDVWVEGIGSLKRFIPFVSLPWRQKRIGIWLIPVV
ncbi:hypothetical protein [Paraprevotella clara]|uniref:hypothetical protein n=1 Tax=Paraprevotella clara TaxID=454154 RepID=UPI00300EBDAB